MQTFTRGLTARFYTTFSRLDGSAVDPTSPTVSIWNGATEIVPAFALTKISTGYYYADWIISGSQTEGTYSALYIGTIDGIVCQSSENFEVVVQGGSVTPGSLEYYCTWDDIKACLLGLDVGDMPSTLQDRLSTFYIPRLKQEIDNYCHQNFDATTITTFIDGSGTDKIILPRRPIKQLTNCILRVIPSISWYQFKRWRHINVVDSQGITVAVQGGPEPLDISMIPPYSGYPDSYSGYSGVSGYEWDWETDITKADLFVDCVNGILTIPPRILYLEMNAIPFWNYTFLRGTANIEVTYEYGYDTDNFPQDLRMAAALLAACQILQLKGITQSGGGANSITIDEVSRNFGGTPYAGLIKDYRERAYNILDRFRRIQIG